MSELTELQEFDLSLIHHFATENNLVGLKEIILQHSESIDKQNKANQTALHCACEIGNAEIAKFLIGEGASILIKDHNEFTPFISACYNGNLDSALLIVDRLTNVDQTDKNGWTSLMWASYKGHTRIVELLLEHDANVHISVAYNVTCLLWAAGRGFFDIVQLICQQGAKVDHVDKYGNTAMIWASRRGASDVVDCLLHHHADPNIVGANGSSSLINAAKGGHSDCVSLLLTNPKVNVNQSDCDGRTALSYAAKRCSVVMTTALLEHGAYLNLADHYGDTPLMKAVKNGGLETVKKLLANFADVDARGKDNKTALHLACETGNIAIIRELLKCGCKIECTNSNKETPLLRAVKCGNILVTKVLLTHGADVSACDQNHDTCVHIAMRSQNIGLVELILQNPKHGRFLYQENKFRETPYDIDIQNNKKILSQLFGSKGFSTAAMCSDSTLDVTSCALAEMLSDPMLESPLCVGLYGKWGNNVMFMLNKIRDQIELFSSPLTAYKKSMFWFTLSLLFYIDIVLSVVVAFLFAERLVAGFVTFFIVMVPSVATLFLIYMGTRLNKFAWTRSASRRLHGMEDYLKLIMRICFLHEELPSSAGKVRYIFAECMNISSFKESEMLSGITSILLTSTEKKVGRLALRIARALPTTCAPHMEGKRSFRKVCCLPSFLFFIFWFIGLSVLIMVVVAMYGPNPLLSEDEHVDGIIALSVISILLACILLMSATVLWNITTSLLFSTNKIARTLGGELSHNRAEISRLSRALSIIDSIKKTKTRICILINALEVNDQSQLTQLVHAVHAVYSSQPIITIMCIDYHLLSSAIQKTSFPDCGDLKGNSFVHHVVQLPLFLPDKRRKKGYFENNGQSDSDIDVDDRNLVKRKKYPKHFDVTKWLVSHDCFHPVNPLLIKRVANIISFTARLLRSVRKDFSWGALSCWIVLSELWPYSTTCMFMYITRKTMAHNKLLKLVYSEIRHLISNNHSMDIHDSYWLQHFISSKACSLTVGDVVSFHQFVVNLDPALEDLIPPFTDNWPTHANSISGSALTSQASEMSLDDVSVCDWSAEDVCRRLKSIQGLDTSNFHYYQDFVHKNNFHGLALSLCDIDELKKELKTSFGDWCLIKKFISETKRNIGKLKRLSFASVASNDKKSSTNADTPHHDSEGDASPVLGESGRVALRKNFKDYLKLQHSSEQPPESIEQHANDNHPLLKKFDVNVE